MLYYNLRLYNHDFNKNFSLPYDKNDFYNGFEEVSVLYYNYKFLASFNAMLILVKVIEFFKFSKKFRLLTEVLESAKLDLSLYIVIFSIILVSFSLSAYLLFGHTLENFSEVKKSIIASYLLLLGRYDSNALQNADKMCGAILFIAMILVFNLFLLNLFISIVVAHYNTLNRKICNEMSLFEKIIFVIKSKYRKKKFMD